MSETLLGLIMISGWITALCVVASVSDAKGLNWVVWTLLSAFFNPAVLLILIITPADDLGIDERHVRTGERVRCANCLETMHPEATVCPHCRRKVEAW